MSRLLPLSILSLLACAATLVSGCRTIYSDTYSNRRNFFVPPAEKKIELPPAARTPPPALSATPSLTPPPADGGLGAGAGAGAGAAPIPGMDAIPGL